MFETLFFTRLLRIIKKDIYVPKRCNVDIKHIEKGDVCDCKIWCKYPPRGNGSMVRIKINNH